MVRSMSEITRREKAARNDPAPHRRVEVEQSLDRLSYLLDGMFKIPGTGWRFGLDALVGLVPGVGDVATSAVSFYILAAGVRHGVPKATLLRMAANIAIDYLLGSIPVVGDLFDAAWKSNQMNVELLRERALATDAERRRGGAGDWLFLGLIMLGLLGLLVGSIVLSLWLLNLLFGRLTSAFG
jgi:hypothetical protein